MATFHIAHPEEFNLHFVRRQRDTLAFTVNVFYEEGIWTAECDALGLVTEADSYEALIKQACEIAPELFALNRPKADIDKKI